jgi:hypothetical protein
MKRNRPGYAVAIIAVIVLGLLSRRYPELLPAVLGKYPGDALWALMVFCGVGFLRPKLPPLYAAILAFTFSCAIEFFKLYQASWIESVRASLPGRLVLGSVFSWKNIAAYAAGILVGWAVETGFCKYQKAGKNRQRAAPGH